MKHVGLIAAGLLFVLGANAQTVRVHQRDGKIISYSSELVSHIDFTERTKEGVDLGLSVRWAQCNIGASSPEEYGTYFPWDGTDYAQSVLGSPWRMPTYSEALELIEKCTFRWDSCNGVAGAYFTAPNGNSIFLPASGFRRLGAEFVGVGTEGNYWTTTQTDYDTAYDLQFYSDGPFMDPWGYIPGTQTIRPVCEYTATENAEKEAVIIIHMTNGQTIIYEDSKVDYIDFTTSALDEERRILLARYDELLTAAKAALVTANNYTQATKLIQSVNQLSSPYTETIEGSLANLLDENTSTFWHSEWTSGSVAGGVHYLQVDLVNPVNAEIYATFTRRKISSHHVTNMSVLGTNDPDADKVACEELLTFDCPYISNTETITSPTFHTNGYRYLRFYANTTTGNSGFWHMSEFQLYSVPLSDDFVSLMNDEYERLQTIVDEQASLSQDQIGEDEYNSLKEAYDAFMSKLAELTDAIGG